jgi:hypothetical protein
MRNRTSSTITVTLAALVLATINLRAGEAWLRYTARPAGSKVAIDGTSTAHDWTTQGAIIGGVFEVEPEFRTDSSLKTVKSLTGEGRCPKVEVTIPVTSLKSTVLVGREKMDEIMREAMRSKEHPAITYKLTAMNIKGEIPPNGSPVKLDTRGELQVAGITNLIDLEISLDRLEGDRLKFSGTKTLNMTAFKIVPPAPKLGLGLIKTGDEVTIKFDWVVGLSKTGPAQTTPPADPAR